jgi:hypothetical protein
MGCASVVDDDGGDVKLWRLLGIIWGRWKLEDGVDLSYFSMSIAEPRPLKIPDERQHVRR